MFCQGETDDVMKKLIEVIYKTQKLREENMILKERFDKAYEFIKQF